MQLNPIQPFSPERKLTDYEAQAILSNARWEIGQNKKAKGCLQVWMSLSLGTPLAKPPLPRLDTHPLALAIADVELRRAKMCPSPLAGKRPPAPPASTARVQAEGWGMEHQVVDAVLHPPRPSIEFSSCIHPWQPMPAAVRRITHPAPTSTSPVPPGAPPSAASVNPPPTTGPASTSPAPPAASGAPSTKAASAPQSQKAAAKRAAKRPRPTALVQADEAHATMRRKLHWFRLLRACGLPAHERDMQKVVSTIAVEQPTERPIRVRRYNAPHFPNGRLRAYAYAKPQLTRAQAAAKAAREAAAAAAAGQAAPGVASAPARAGGDARVPLQPLNAPQKRARDEEGDAAEAPPAKRGGFQNRGRRARHVPMDRQRRHRAFRLGVTSNLPAL